MHGGVSNLLPAGAGLCRTRSFSSARLKAIVLQSTWPWWTELYLARLLMVLFTRAVIPYSPPQTLRLGDCISEYSTVVASAVVTGDPCVYVKTFTEVVPGLEHSSLVSTATAVSTGRAGSPLTRAAES